MKNKRELELEIEVLNTRKQLLNAHYQILSRDAAENDQLRDAANKELAELIRIEVNAEENKKTGEI